MKFKIIALDLVFQRRATAREQKRDAKRTREEKQLTQWKEGHLALASRHEIITVDIPVGAERPEATDITRRLILRAVVAHMQPQDEFFYVRAHFESEDRKTTFVRTIAPRKEIDISLRRLRH